MVRAYVICGEEDKYIRDFNEKSESKRPLGRNRRRQEDNIKVYLKEIKTEECGLHLSGSGLG